VTIGNCRFSQVQEWDLFAEAMTARSDNNREDLVAAAIAAIRRDMLTQVSRAAGAISEELHELEIPIASLHAQRVEESRVWTLYVDAINQILKRYFEKLLAIGVANGAVIPNPVAWVYETLRAEIASLQSVIESTFISTYAGFLDDVDVSLESLWEDLTVEIDWTLSQLRSDAVISLAGGREDSSATASSIFGTKPEIQEPPSASAVAHCTDSPFKLVDLEDPPDGTSKQEVIAKLYPHLKRAITRARVFCDRQDQKGKKTTNEELAKNFSIFEDARADELKHVLERKLAPSDCAVEIIHGRTRQITRDSVIRYIRDKSSRKS
jgi:hypothetical protein